MHSKRQNSVTIIPNIITQIILTAVVLLLITIINRFIKCFLPQTYLVNENRNYPKKGQRNNYVSAKTSLIKIKTCS